MNGSATGATTVRRQLETLHQELRRDLDGLDRIAVALLDPAIGALRTFVHSTLGSTPFALHEVPLAKVPSLARLAAEGSDRVVDDLHAFAAGPSVHSRGLVASGLRSSYTRPFADDGRISGFVFFDSTRLGYFRKPPRHRLAALADLVALRVAAALAPVRLLAGAVAFARELARLRDDETGEHLARMARYARLIARAVAAGEGRDDEFVEYVHLFAPLHDIGKIGTPDAVLRKRDRLVAGEVAVMRRHVEHGLAMVDVLGRAFGLGAGDHLEWLRNIVAAHHERVDGRGYPAGLVGRGIPLEARIVAVADVFDALTTVRPYKPAWSNRDAFEHLERLAGEALDADCVQALVAGAAEVERIQRAGLAAAVVH